MNRLLARMPKPFAVPFAAPILTLIVLTLTLSLGVSSLLARDTRYDFPNVKDGIRYTFGDGVHFQYQENKYHLHLTGYVSPNFTQIISEGNTPPPFPLYVNPATGVRAAANTTDRNIDIYEIRDARLQFAAQATEERVSGFLDVDFSDPFPLYEAWISHHAVPDRFYVTLGQKHTFTNNRTHNAPENKLAFEQRSALSRYFTDTGREWGLFLEGIAPTAGKVVVKPGFAVTTGDGRNAFGARFNEFNLGGLKLGFRLDLLFLGEFQRQGDTYAIDIVREPQPKFALGFAYSTNQGASDPRGDGRNNLLLYDASAQLAYGDINKLYFSWLLKHRGFSWLLEYADVNADAGNRPLYTSTAIGPDSLLTTANLGQFYAVGRALNTQIGYFWSNGFALHFGYSMIRPENATTLSNLDYVPFEDWFTIGISQFFAKNWNGKFTISYSIVDGRPFLNSTDSNQNDYNVTRLSLLMNF